MKVFLSIIIVTQVTQLLEGTSCKFTKIQCVDEKQFQICVNVGKRPVLIGKIQNCTEGTICDDNNFFPCVKVEKHPQKLVTSVSVLAEDVPSEVTPPSCSGSSKHPANLCNQYYECVPVWWWWQPELKTCPDGLAFDPTISDCSPAGPLECFMATTTIAPSTLPPVTPPACFESIKSPATLCNQYYECVPVWWWWQPELKTCPEGQAFDEVKSECGLADPLSCDLAFSTTITTTDFTTITTNTAKFTTTTQTSTSTRSTTLTTTPSTTVTTTPSTTATTSTTVTTTKTPSTTLIIPSSSVSSTSTTVPSSTNSPITPPAPITPPTCSGDEKYPAPSCYQYYQCRSVLWWGTYETLTCPDGQAFDNTLKECAPAANVNCGIAETTTSATPTTPGSTSCTGEGVRPAPACNQYYHCIKVMWWWDYETLTCPSGEGFDPVSKKCSSLIKCN